MWVVRKIFQILQSIHYLDMEPEARFGGGIYDFESDDACSGNLTLIHTAESGRSLNPLWSIKSARLTGFRNFAIFCLRYVV